MDNKLLVFESDPAHGLADILAEHLTGWTVVTAALPANVTDAGAALIAQADKAPEIAAALRQARMIGPIFVLASEEDAVSPPLVPLARPLRLATLTARLDAPGVAAVDGSLIGPYRFDAGARALVHTAREHSERLTDKEAQVLDLLLRNPDGLSREALQEAAFGYAADIGTHTVETHIWRLRQKLGDELLLTRDQGSGIRYQLILDP